MHKKTKVQKRGSIEVQESTRLKLIAYLKKHIGTQKQVAEIFGIRERSVRRIWSKYQQGGIQAARNKKRGARDGNKLNVLSSINKEVLSESPEQISNIDKNIIKILEAIKVIN